MTGIYIQAKKAAWYPKLKRTDLQSQPKRSKDHHASPSQEVRDQVNGSVVFLLRACQGALGILAKEGDVAQKEDTNHEPLPVSERALFRAPSVDLISASS